MKKTIRNAVLIVLAMAIVASVSIFGTLAWLSDEDGAVNVMTLGNVYIEQNEYEWNNGALDDFTQGKPLLPYVGSLTFNGNDPFRQLQANNVVDKYVTVTNTGSTSAFVRTILAFELGSLTLEQFNTYVGVVKDETAWIWGVPFVATINDNNYVIMAGTHTAAVKPAEETIPSLLQVYMDKTADNEQVNAIDGNGNGMYDILAFSQAIQSTGFESADEALVSGFGLISATTLDKLPWNATNVDLPIIVTTAEQFTEVLTEAGKANAGNTEIILAADLDLTGVNWTPINVDGYHGAGVVTLDGGNNTITGLNAPLFEGGFAGKSGIVIKHLTIADSTIKSNSSLGAGAFIANADSMHVITLEDCHLVDSTIDSPESRNGGLIGWASGYAKLNDGPVKAYITIENCSVIGCDINGTSVGAIVGHPGASDYTYTTIKNCVAVDNTLTSTDDGEWRVGAIVGTANNGHVEIIDCTIGGNVMTQPACSGYTNKYNGDEVGRFVPAGTGTLVVNGTVVGATTADELKDLLKDDGEATLLGDVQWNTKIDSNTAIDLNGNTFEAMGTINLGNNADLTMVGGNYEVNGTYGHVDVRPDSAQGSTLYFEGVNFSYNKLEKTYGPSTNRLGSVIEICAAAADAHTSVVFKNCTFDNAMVLIEGMSGKTGTFEVTFENCTFNALTSGAPIKVDNYVAGTLNVIGCTFNLECTSGTASAVSVSPSSSTTVTLNAENNTVNATVATPSGEAGTVEQVKVNGTPANIKFASFYENVTANITGTTATGIAVA